MSTLSRKKSILCQNGLPYTKERPAFQDRALRPQRVCPPARVAEGKRAAETERERRDSSPSSRRACLDREREKTVRQWLMMETIIRVLAVRSRSISQSVSVGEIYV